jgi:hypothetical protein
MAERRERAERATQCIPCGCSTRDTGSPFEYELLRTLYAIRRDSQVAD